MHFFIDLVLLFPLLLVYKDFAKLRKAPQKNNKYLDSVILSVLILR